MAVDNRPFKSKEQDGQGNEVIIRDQQLVEQGTATTMASGACFETRDVDDRPVKIPRDNMMNIVLECIGIILNDSSRNLGTNVQKALGLQGNTVGHSTVADFASVLGVANGKWYPVNGSQTTDANTADVWACYIFGGGVDFINNPLGINNNKVLLTYLAGYGFKLQVCYSDAPGIKFRLYNGSLKIWTQWYTVSVTS